MMWLIGFVVVVSMMMGMLMWFLRLWMIERLFFLGMLRLSMMRLGMLFWIVV